MKKKKFRAILIDVNDELVKLVEIEADDKGSNLPSIYKHLGCSCFTIAWQYENRDALFVDDEGLLKQSNESKWFSIEGLYQPFIGNGLIIGSDEEGDTADAKTDLAYVIENVRFYTQAAIRYKYGKE